MSGETESTYTIRHLRDLAWGKPGADGGRPSTLISEVATVRYVPTDVIKAAGDLLYKKEDTVAALDFVNNAFYIFRACVNTDPFTGVPHVFVGGAYEWPRIVDFPWSDVEGVNALGETINGRGNRLSVKIIDPSKQDVSEISETGALESRQMNELERYVQDMEDSVRFVIPSLEVVGLVADRMSWQNRLLDRFSNSFYQISIGLKNKSLSEEKMRNFLAGQLDIMDNRPYQEMVGRYSFVGKKSSRIGFKTIFKK